MPIEGMDAFLNRANSAADAPFLQNVQGWKFFLHVDETSAGHWRGSVRIHGSKTCLVSRWRCREERSTEAEALRDADALAQSTLLAIDEKLQRSGERAGRHPRAPNHRHAFP